MADTLDHPHINPGIESTVSLQVPITGVIKSAGATLHGGRVGLSDIVASIAVGGSGEHFRGEVDAYLHTTDLLAGNLDYALLDAAAQAATAEVTACSEEILHDVQTSKRNAAVLSNLGGLATALASGGVMHYADKEASAGPLVIFGVIGLAGLTSMAWGIKTAFSERDQSELSEKLTRLKILQTKPSFLRELRKAAANSTPKVTIRRRAQPDGADASTPE